MHYYHYKKQFMSAPEKTVITIETTINAPVEKVWKAWNTAEDVVQWNSASPEWHTPRAENDFRTGGKFLYRMEARDGSFGFDFYGMYDTITPHEYIEYTMGDDRKVKTTFTANGNATHIVQAFEAESTNSIDMQRTGWQAILDNFKRYAESATAQ